MPPQLVKNHVVPTAWQDEALARDGVSIDGSPPGSPVPGILQARTLEWVA